MSTQQRYHGDPLAAAPLSYGAKRAKLESDLYYLSPAHKGRLYALADRDGMLEAGFMIEFIDEYGTWL